MYTLTDAAVVAGDAVSRGFDAAEVAAAAAPQKNGGWFGFISDAMEIVLKVRKLLVICGFRGMNRQIA